jgi:hypothetical protein
VVDNPAFFSEIVDRLYSPLQRATPQSESRELVDQRPDERLRPDNRISIRVGQLGARIEDFSFKSAIKLGLQMVYELNEKSTI